MANQSPLLSLPTELRLKVLHNLLHLPMITIAEFDSEGYAPDESHIYPSIKDVQVHASAQVLRVCKTIYREGLPILYKENHFQIWDSTNMLNHIFLRIGSNSKMIRKLWSEQRLRTPTSDIMVRDFDPEKSLVKILRVSDDDVLELRQAQQILDMLSLVTPIQEYMNYRVWIRSLGTWQVKRRIEKAPNAILGSGPPPSSEQDERGAALNKSLNVEIEERLAAIEKCMKSFPELLCNQMLPHHDISTGIWTFQ